MQNVGSKNPPNDWQETRDDLSIAGSKNKIRPFFQTIICYGETRPALSLLMFLWRCKKGSLFSLHYWFSIFETEWKASDGNMSWWWCYWQNLDCTRKMKCRRCVLCTWRANIFFSKKVKVLWSVYMCKKTRRSGLFLRGRFLHYIAHFNMDCRHVDLQPPTTRTTFFLVKKTYTTFSAIVMACPTFVHFLLISRWTSPCVWMGSRFQFVTFYLFFRKLKKQTFY